MKRINIVGLFILLSVFLCNCDKPDALKEEAFLEIENTSSSSNITGVYYANTGYGTNRISSNIGPGETRTFTLNAEDDYIYNIKVTSDNSTYGDYTFDDVHFYDDRRITVSLTNDGWDGYFPW